MVGGVEAMARGSDSEGLVARNDDARGGGWPWAMCQGAFVLSYRPALGDLRYGLLRVVERHLRGEDPCRRDACWASVSTTSMLGARPMSKRALDRPAWNARALRSAMVN